MRKKSVAAHHPQLALHFDREREILARLQSPGVVALRGAGHYRGKLPYLVLAFAHGVGLDRYAPPHTHGSTHGETRITRQAIGEGEEYSPFAIRSHQIWREIETDTAEIEW